MQAHKGVTGQILDYDTNLPITNANLTITGRPITFWSSKDRGEFWRILLPRDYELEVNILYNLKLLLALYITGECSWLSPNKTII